MTLVWKSIFEIESSCAQTPNQSLEQDIAKEFGEKAITKIKESRLSFQISNTSNDNELPSKILWEKQEMFFRGEENKNKHGEVYRLFFNQWGFSSKNVDNMRYSEGLHKLHFEIEKDRYVGFVF